MRPFFSRIPTKTYKDFHTFASHTEATEFLVHHDALCLIIKGREHILNAIKLRCPDSCGDIFTINLDRSVGKSWRCFIEGKKISVSPSIWRTEDCGAHFTLRNNNIYLYDKSRW
jgi:hypothetical protein